MTEFGQNAQGEELAKLAADTIRLLAADGVQAAKSGHPGMPMGAADVAHVLWTQFLRLDPADPSWIDRDRFVLSAGHASMLLYALVHLAGFDLPMDELKRFRQLGSRTPGHPEYGHTPGVEATGGPLGAGFAMAVGLALAERMLAARFNRPGHEVLDHFTYALSSDGCMMEGITHEAASLAGHLGLGRLIVFYDDNEITIEGDTGFTFTEDVNRRYEVYHWHVQDIDGHDHGAIAEAIRAAQAEAERPSLIVCHTTIGRGAPHKAGQAGTHGEPLGDEELAATKQQLGWPQDRFFFVPESVRDLWHRRQQAWQRERAQWNERFAAYAAAHKGLARALQDEVAGKLPRNLRKTLKPVPAGEVDATRSSGGAALNHLAAAVPQLVGGAADLAPSTKTVLKEFDFVSPGHFEGRNLHFGVREHAMGNITNGLALHGGLRPFCATFLVFADYMRASIRLAALQGVPVLFYFTHDSIFVGEDGPTHQPVEQIESLRCIPNLLVMRPCDANETGEALCMALEHTDGPVALCLTRQKLPALDRMQCAPAEGARRGAYVLREAPAGKPDLLLIASGSEVHLALELYDRLVDLGRQPRVVSMVSMEVFDAQSARYRGRVLPKRVRTRVTLEASRDAHWHKYAGDRGLVVGLQGFGASAPYQDLAEHFGFTADAVLDRMRARNML